MNWLGEKIQGYVQWHDRILDVGCGIMDAVGGALGPRHMGIDGFRPYLEHCKRDALVMQGELPDVLLPFIDKSWDVLLLLDVVEHLEKHKALQLIGQAERLAVKRVIIFTPLGYRLQSPFDCWGLGYNGLQEHLCGFEKEELEELGYATEICDNDVALFGVKEF